MNLDFTFHNACFLTNKKQKTIIQILSLYQQNLICFSKCNSKVDKNNSEMLIV